MARSGQVEVAEAGTAVRGPDQPGSVFVLAANPGNSDVAWVGNVAGDVADANGFPLVASTGIPVVVHVYNLNELWFDVASSGDKVCWLKVR